MFELHDVTLDISLFIHPVTAINCYDASRVVNERSYTILVCLRLDIYSALELNNLFNPTLISIEIDYKSV